MAVNERIFLVSGQQFFDQESLSRIFSDIRRHVERSLSDNPQYRVLIARADNVDLPKDHPVPDSPSQDLLLISPNVVGGYISVDDQSYLRVVVSEEDYLEAHAYYEKVRDSAFRFDTAWQDAVEMRASWLDRETRVGFWNEQWSFENRDSVYYDLYDLHIRTWVPGYDDFLVTTASRVVDALLRLQEVHRNGQVNVLEVGSGTGNLTLKLLAAVEHRRSARQVFGRLFSVDKADEMVRATRNAVRNTMFKDHVKVCRGFAFESLSNEVLDAAPYGIICGSLVLSHLLQSEIEERLEKLMEACKELLLPGGSVVLADALVTDPAQRQVLRRRWEKDMVLQGLPPKRAEHFLRYNQEMLETATEAELKACEERHGFRLTIDDIPGFDSPFRTIVFQRRV